MVEGIRITARGFEFADGEAKKYIDYVKEHSEKPNDEKLTEVIVTMCDDGKVDVDYKFEGAKFERIRRITGYLVGSMDSWNDSKRAEEHERVKHGVENYE